MQKIRTNTYHFLRETSFKKIITALVYIFLYQYIYVSYLNKEWEYFGYHLYSCSVTNYLITILISFLPILFYRGLISLSSYISILIYVLCYVPIIMTLTFDIYNNHLIVLTYQFVLMIGMLSFFLVDRISLKKSFNAKQIISINIVHVITFIFTIYLLIIFKGKMHLVSFDNVYDLRSDNNLSSSFFVNYIELWLSYCFYPLYFTLGVLSRKYSYLIIGIIGEIMIYSINGSKASFLSPIIIFCFVFLLKRNGKLTFFQVFVFAITFLSSLIFVAGSSLNLVATIFFMRTLSIPGLLAVQYIDFFSNHPYTYYSHINVINILTRLYPYGQDSLGQVIGSYVYSSNDMNANANFWVTDGVAACGQIGVLIISFVMAVFLLFMNFLFKSKNKILTMGIFTPSILTVLNVSFFTTLLSGGMLFLIIILLLVKLPKLNNTPIKE